MPHLRSLIISLVWGLVLLACAPVQAQNVEARLASFTPPASGVRNARPLVLRKNDRLLPDDELITGAGGRIVIALTDGSVVTLAANAHVVLKDFRQPATLRELLDVLAGRLRVKIKKLGGRPNPYRLNSPTASIAVRGTEFTVRVAANGETAVAVSEGLVEVTSLRDPTQRRLVEPGRNVIVRANGDLSFRLPGPGGEMEAQLRPLSEQASPYFRAAADAVAFSLDETQRAVTERSFNNLPVRLAAFADGAFDSLNNPAYAAQFTRAAGRVYLLPTFSAPLVQVAPGLRNEAHWADFAGAAQASYFAPLGERWVVGGAAAFTHASTETFTRQRTREAPWLVRTNTLAGALQADAGTFALVAARKLGARDSLGFKLEHTASRAALLTREESLEELPDATFRDRFFTDVDAHGRRTTASFGWRHVFARGGQLGVNYSHGWAGGGEQYQRDRVQAGLGDPLQTRDVTGRLGEIAVLWRAALTQRLFYGVEGGWLRERVSETQTRRNSVLREARDIERPRLGGGLGVALRQRTFLSADVSFVERRAQAVERVSFLNGHLALQSEVGRRWLMSAAVLRVYERRYVEQLDLTERRWRTFGQFGWGWRLRPAWLAQYFISTDFGRRGPSHTLVLRYVFDGAAR